MAYAKLKTKWFNKWAKKNALADKDLLKTIDNISNILGVVNLGGGLFKIRAPKVGQGKGGGISTRMILPFFFMVLQKPTKIIWTKKS